MVTLFLPVKRPHFGFMTAMLQKPPIGVLGTACPGSFSKLLRVIRHSFSFLLK
jgi:hypothetical protein